MSDETILSVENLSKVFRTGRTGWLGRKDHAVRAVDDVSFALRRGETLGIVGESGCGKSTTARMIVGLLKPSGGRVRFHGRDVHEDTSQDRRQVARNLQMVFQDPFSSLNPRHNVQTILSEPFRIHGIKLSSQALHQAVVELLSLIGLDENALGKFPHEFSGGQRQRINIARAIALRPEIIICDESVSALDVSIQAQILNLLRRLQAELGLTYLFVSHDLGVVRYISDRVAVMYLGRVVEIGDCDAIYRRPCHPYTRLLFSAIPADTPFERRNIAMLPAGDAAAPPGGGCAFYPRCDKASAACRRPVPDCVLEDGRRVACHLYAG
ncbi:ABC transporter ATP-binding protein [Martelella alba]|uniref:ABC transporter ATP-binding protein n=1 Tax=Martelella alba TaxID=2590451 RepID=A0ABY2SEC7_9HYPH|nr:oligopeptide/dipeptide ABC transporter ATP-binding protein [Martelella alba]TKI02629.1 ABC transporter ATP-binding protein [Martelella alba]